MAGPLGSSGTGSGPGVHPLIRHPRTPATAVSGIEAAVTWRPDGSLALSYTLAGDPARLRIPPPLTPDRADGLWRRTCFEAFLRDASATAYREFNLSPSGQWQVYDFGRYREGGTPAPVVAPDIVCHVHADRLVLEAVIRPQALPAGARLELGLCAVVEAADGGLSYWALRHPTERPDFHHTGGFALALERPAP